MLVHPIPSRQGHPPPPPHKTGSSLPPPHTIQIHPPPQDWFILPKRLVYPRTRLVHLLTPSQDWFTPHPPIKTGSPPPPPPTKLVHPTPPHNTDSSTPIKTGLFSPKRLVHPRTRLVHLLTPSQDWFTPPPPHPPIKTGSPPSPPPQNWFIPPPHKPD